MKISVSCTTYIKQGVFFVKELMFTLCVVLGVIWHKYTRTSLLFPDVFYYKLIECFAAVDAAEKVIDALDGNAGKLYPSCFGRLEFDGFAMSWYSRRSDHRRVSRRRRRFVSQTTHRRKMTRGKTGEGFAIISYGTLRNVG